MIGHTFGKMGRVLLVMLHCCLLLLAVYASTVLNGAKEEESSSPGPVEDKEYVLFTRLFLHKRKEQLKAAAELRGKDDYAKQYELAKTMLTAMFKVLVESWTTVNETGLKSPQQVLPDDPKSKEVVSSVLEVTAFIGDLAIQLPEITRSIFKRNKPWKPVLVWSVDFCNSSSVYQDSSTHSLHLRLLAQEIGLAPDDPNLLNPYRSQQEDVPVVKENSKKRKERPKRERGPRLRGARQTEL